MAEIRSCEDCIHVEVCALCVPPLPVCDLFLSKHDVVEVVRCKDCVAAVTDEDGMLWCDWDGHHVDADFYCDSGERKANGG